MLAARQAGQGWLELSARPAESYLRTLLAERNVCEATCGVQLTP